MIVNQWVPAAHKGDAIGDSARRVRSLLRGMGHQSDLYAMTIDDRGRPWFVETGPQPNMVVGFDPGSEKFFSATPIAESGGRTVRHMTFDSASGSLWFGTDANTIARAKLR